MMEKGKYPVFIIDSKMKSIIGVRLSFDFRAEHERGIDGLKEKLDVSPSTGLIRKFNKEFFYFSINSYHSALCFNGPFCFEAFWNYYCKKLPSDLVAFWDSESFLIQSCKKVFVSDLYNAFKRLDVKIWLNQGLNIAIASKINQT